LFGFATRSTRWSLAKSIPRWRVLAGSPTLHSPNAPRSLPVTDGDLAGRSAPFAGRWLIERELGRGGSAAVYLARDLKLDRKVAVKVLHEGLAASIGAERFLREVRVAARLSHPHIVQVHDSGEFEGRLYYVMPYVEGETLRDHLARHGPMPWPDATRLAIDVADALSYAHGAGLVHRDIKPENILLHSGHAVLGDFGIARALSVTLTGDTHAGTLTEAGLVLGTPLYMSPEQITGGVLDGRSDLYSLGCVLYEMIAGVAPLDAPTLSALLALHALSDAPALRVRVPAVPASLDAIVSSLLARDPGRRPPSAATLRDELRAVVDTPANTTVAWNASGGRRVPWHRRRALWAGVAALALVAAFLAWRGTRSSADQSVAVLPFASESSVSDDQYFADGMTDEIINALVRVPGLTVASRNSVFAQRDSRLDPRTAGNRLHASTLITGSVQRANGMLRVSVQLVKASDGTVTWSENFRRDDKAIFEVQEEVARAIASALRGRMRPTGGALVSRGTDNVEAWDEYQRGRYLWGQRARGAPAILTAIQHFDRAIALDSSFARAWAGLADAYSLLPGFGDAPPTKSFARARTAAQRAIALDPALGEAHTSLGIITMFYDRNWDGARQIFEHAIALDSTDSRTHLFYSWSLAALNRWGEGEREMRAALRLDPSSPLINARLGTVLLYRRHFAEGERLLRSVIAADSTNDAARVELSRNLLMQGRAEEALKELPDAPLLRDSYIGDGLRAGILARTGRLAESQAVMARLERRASKQYITPESFAFAAILRGDTTATLDWLERAVRDRSFFVIFIACDPIFASLQDNARYQKVLRDAGLRPFVQ
jgi:eukaryotic-like serine/threonine-protein kinase